MNEIIERLKGETPKFFKKVIALGGILLATGTALLAAPEGVELPQIVKSIAGYLATAGFIMSTIASFARVDSPKG